MPGPRTKRKRTETDGSTMAAPPSSRRNRRDPNSGPEPFSPPGSASPTDRIPLKSETTQSSSNKMKPVYTAPSDENKQLKTVDTKSEQAAEISEKISVSKKGSEDGNEHADSEAEIIKRPLHEEETQNKKEEQSTAQVSRRALKMVPEQAGDSGGASVRGGALNASIKVNAVGDKSMTEKPKQSREKRIRSLLIHRKLLLERLRQGRTAAQNRLNQIQADEPPEQKSETDEEERIRFWNFGREVTAMARKQSRNESVDVTGAAENSITAGKRTSLSLRKGPSVGKRMNVALSSLAPGHIAAGVPISLDPAADGPSSAAVVENPSVSSKIPAATAASRVVSASYVTGVSVNRSLTPMVATVPSSATPSANTTVPTLPAMTPITISKKASTAPAVSSASGTLVPGGRLVGQKGVRPSQASTQQHQVVSSIARVAHQSQHQQLTVATAIVNTTNRASSSSKHNVLPSSNITGVATRRQGPIIVVVPEAVALRERKQVIEKKLAQMATKLSPQNDSLSQPSFHQTHKRVVPSSGQFQREQSTFDFSITAAPGLPMRLPNRRKTHWDTLLEEMRWLATDFIEERKWKLSASRALAHSAVQKAGQRQLASSHSAVFTTTNASVATENIMESPKSGTRYGGGLSNGSHKRVALQSCDGKTAKVPVFNPLLALNHEDLSQKRDVAHKSASIVTEFLSSYRDETRSLNVDQEHPMDTGDERLGTIPGESEPINFMNRRQTASLLADREKKHEEYGKISERIESFMYKVKAARDCEPVGSNTAGILPQQAAAFGFSEELWKRINVGCLLTGTCSSGKTHAICMILSENRNAGPHLLICSPGSLVKWCDKLSHFNGLSVVSFNKSNPHLEPCSVLVCSYRNLEKIEENILLRFKTFVIDSRYPVGFRGSRPKICLETFENESHSFLSLSSPEQIASTDWWESTVSCIMESDARRILVDPFDAEDLLGLLSGLSDRAVLEHLSLRVAFLLGKAVFPTSWRAFKKNILGWSRSHIKRSGEKGSKFLRVRTLFCSILDSVTYRLKNETNRNLALDIISCEMTPLQQSTYELCCNNVMAALSRRLWMDDETVDFLFESVADALIRLRRICTHANIFGVFNTMLQGPRVHVLKRNAPSQPNVELALSILEGSGKLKELIRILLNEAEVEVLPEVVQTLKIHCVSINRSKAPQNGSAKKVAILAVLPEIQVLVSLLLNSLGISHEALLDSSPGNKEKMSSSWLKGQHILSRFNDKATRLHPIVNIIVAAPVVVAGNHGGLGVESADIIILVDEDWSGRGELLITSLLSRVTFGKQAAGTAFCRLVAKDSCEDIFVSSVPIAIECPKSDCRIPWPVDFYGVLTPPKDLQPDEESRVKNSWISMDPRQGILSFPGRALVSLSNRKMEEVLCGDWGDRLLFGTDSDPRFLPSVSGSLDVDTQIRLMKFLSRSEDECSISFFQRFPGMHLVSILPPLPNDFVFEDSFEMLGMLPITGYLKSVGTEFLDPEAAIVQVLSTVDRPALLSPKSEADVSEKANPKNVEDNVINLLAGGFLAYSSCQDSLTSRNGQNAFASLYRSSSSLRYNDGGQGSEMLVYFPPIFPRLLESSIIASESVDSLRMRGAVAKRALLPSSADFGSKRSKASDGSFLPMSITAEPSPVLTEEDATRNDAASVLADLTDDYGLAGVGAIPLPRDSALFAGQISTEGSSNLISFDSRFVSDLMSRGLPADLEEAEEMRSVNSVPPNTGSMILIVSRKRQRAQISTGTFHQPVRHQQLGLGTSPNSMVQNLVASNGVAYGTNLTEPGKKMKKQDQPSFERTPSGLDQPPNPAASLPLVATAFMPTNNVLKIKDIHRKNLMAASRHAGHGATVFDATPFRAAAVRLRNKICHRLSRLCWQSGNAFEAGPGLPLIVSKPQSLLQGFRGHFEPDPALWTSVVKRLKNSVATTGDEAIEVSGAQLSALRRSLAAPVRVDFGPFNSGFLALPSGMTAISPPRPSVGVKLPMGVKLPQTAKDQMVPWTDKEEAMLKQSTIRFGFNWTLSSRVLSGLQDVITVSRHPQAMRSMPRAAKTCREHWQSLARSDPNLSKEVRKVERMQRENSTLRFRDSFDLAIEYKIVESSKMGEGDTADSVPSSASLLVLCTPEETAELMGCANGEDEKEVLRDGEALPKLETLRRRSFNAIGSARKKIEQTPNSIPCINSGGSPTVTPSHASHMQSVQSSVASSWTSGRTEMWPLNFLDAADRFRATQAQRAVSSATTPTRSPAPSGPGPRQHTSSLTVHASPPASSHRSTSTSYSASSAVHAAPPASSHRATSISYSATSARGSIHEPSKSTAQSFAPPPIQTPKPPT